MQIRLLCFGDSFTFGDELWEEQNVYGYANMTYEMAMKRLAYSDEISKIKNSLTYAGFIANKKPNWIVHNFGVSGYSQMATTLSIIKQVTQLKEEYPNDLIICSLQDTYRTRYAFHSSNHGRYVGFNPNSPKMDLLYHPEIKDFAIFTNIFLNEEILATQFYCSSLGIKEWLKHQNIPSLNFAFCDHTRLYHYDVKDSALDIMKQEYLEGVSLYHNGAIVRASEYYGLAEHELKLPGHHIKHKYHEIVADDIIEYIEANIL